MNARLHPDNIAYSINEQGSTLHGEISGAFAAYYLLVMGAKHEYDFCDRVSSYSDNIDLDTAPDDIKAIANESKPKLNGNPEKANLKRKP